MEVITLFLAWAGEDATVFTAGDEAVATSGGVVEKLSDMVGLAV